MKAIKINTAARTIEEINVEGLEDMQAAVDGYIEVATEVDKKNTLYVNEDGMFLQEDFFTIEGGHQPFRGNGIVVGFNYRTGESKDASVSIGEVRAKVKFFTALQIKMMAMAGAF